MDKTILLQKQVRDNSEDLRGYLQDLAQWEDEMKRKEPEICSGYNVPEVPIPRKSKKTMNDKQNKKEVAKRINSYDYAGWDTFDVDAECEKLDKTNETSESENEDLVEEHNTLLKDEANYEKERGNQFVKNKKWDEAICCYTHAIACYAKDPIYFANRALCFLKKNDLKSAEADCTSALQLESNYVKALLRRAVAREGLKQFNDAMEDLKRVLQLEPHNKESKTQLQKLEKLIGIKTNFDDFPKPSTSKEILVQSEEVQLQEVQEPLIVQKPTIVKNSVIPKEISWPVRTSLEIILPIQKLPHQRSKKPLHRIKIVESDNSDIYLSLEQKSDEGENKNIDYSDSNALAEILAQSSHVNMEKVLGKIEKVVKREENIDTADKTKDKENSIQENLEKEESINSIDKNLKKKTADSIEVDKIKKTKKKDINSIDVVNSVNNEMENQKAAVTKYSIPKSSIQFYSNWKMMKDNKTKFLYFKNIDPAIIPYIFQDSLESDIFSEIICVLHDAFIQNNVPVFLYLLYLSKVKRFSMLTMFMTQKDKIALKEIFEYCERKNDSEKNHLDLLRKKYDL